MYQNECWFLRSVFLTYPPPRNRDTLLRIVTVPFIYAGLDEGRTDAVPAFPHDAPCPGVGAAGKPRGSGGRRVKNSDTGACAEAHSPNVTDRSSLPYPQRRIGR